MRFVLAMLISTIIIMMSACSNNHSNTEKTEITVAAAASLNEALSDLKGQFEKENKDIKILLNLAGSGMLQQQIIQGAPIDVFISASEEQFATLKDKQMIGESKALLKNRLVLITPENSQIKTLQDLGTTMAHKIAIGTPESVPAGMYAKQALQSSQVWDTIQDKLVLSKDVKQVLTYVETGNVDAGLVYATDAKVSKKVSITEEIPDSNHSPIIYPAGIVKATKYNEQSKEFFHYLKSEKAKEIFQKYGFEVLD